MELSLLGKYIINANLVCKTGLHIGGSTSGFEIGGIDNPVVKDPLTDEPYIPGSGLKGKLRSLLEWALGPNEFNGKPHHFTQPPDGKPAFGPCSCGQCAVCVLFGVTPTDGVKKASDVESQENSFAMREGDFFLTGPTRLTIRDSFLTGEAKTEMDQLLGKSIYTEVKTENSLDRVTAEANPRPMERVPKGAAFNVEMVLDVYAKKDKELLKALFTALHLLEDSALGGTTSRGSGAVQFADISAKFRSIDYYKNQETERIVQGIPKTVSEIIGKFDSIWENFPNP
jgi:CRISPR-associated protein Csm3